MPHFTSFIFSHHRRRFGKPAYTKLIIFVVAFAAVGSVLLYATHAATISPISASPQTGTLTGGARVVSDSTAIGGEAVQFGGDPDPSGQAPPAVASGFHSVCTENFTKDAATGTWGTSDAGAVVYQDGCKWTEYPDGWPSTYTNGQPGYYPGKVLSVHDGELDFSLQNVNGYAAGANPSPVLSSGSGYQTYGKYIVRAEFADVSNYHAAWLLWPSSDADWQSAESDFPEFDLGGTGVSAYAHYGGSGAQDIYTKAIDTTQWHTYEQDWTSSGRSYYVDGTLIGTSTNANFSGEERWQLQTEPSSHASGGSGHVLVDWVEVEAPN